MSGVGGGGAGRHRRPTRFPGSTMCVTSYQQEGQAATVQLTDNMHHVGAETQAYCMPILIVTQSKYVNIEDKY